jgi:hypothetical protein
MRQAYVKHVVDKVALERVFLSGRQLSPVSISSPGLHTHLQLHVAVTRRTHGLRLGTFPISNALSEIGSTGQENTFTVLMFNPLKTKRICFI